MQAKIIERAGEDGVFRSLLVSDSKAAIRELTGAEP